MCGASKEPYPSIFPPSLSNLPDANARYFDGHLTHEDDGEDKVKDLKIIGWREGKREGEGSTRVSKEEREHGSTGAREHGSTGVRSEVREYGRRCGST